MKESSKFDFTVRNFTLQDLLWKTAGINSITDVQHLAKLWVPMITNINGDNMKKYLLFLVILGCSKCPVIPSSTETFEDIALGICVSTNLPSKEYVINNEIDYKKLQSSGNCTNQFPSIDFSKKTLLGKFTSGKCKMTISKSLVIDKVNKSYTYYLSVCEKGFCKSLAVNMNWILINKLETGYTLKFVVEKR